MTMRLEFPEIPFDSFREQLDSVVFTTINKIDRECPAALRTCPHDICGLLESLLRASENTYKTVRYLVADHPADASRKTEFALSVPPLARTLLDTLFTIVFLFQDPPQMSALYFKSGWRELAEEQEHQRARYGQKDTWKRWLAEKDELIEIRKKEWGITVDEAANLKHIKWWPVPGQMIKSTMISQKRRDYLSYLNDWYYRSLSSQSHLSLPGLVYRSAALIPRQDEGDRIWRLSKQKSDVFATTVVLLLAVVSEVELEIRFGLGERMKYIWGVLGGFYGYANDFYEIRYQPHL